MKATSYSLLLQRRPEASLTFLWLQHYFRDTYNFKLFSFPISFCNFAITLFLCKFRDIYMYQNQATQSSCTMSEVNYASDL